VLLSSLPPHELVNDTDPIGAHFGKGYKIHVCLKRLSLLEKLIKEKKKKKEKIEKAKRKTKEKKSRKKDTCF
jgi:hypothetical protein